ncbi:hypothetical protein Rs2_18836 [Raphanus sativus]|nr:hypothetical protein Rs2_18836 [Raphanus sativus]
MRPLCLSSKPLICFGVLLPLCLVHQAIPLNSSLTKCSLPLNSSSFIWYKGVIEGRSYVIKRFTEPVFGEEERGYNDIVLSARVSNHSGFLKLVGCCLEFPYPVLLFEDLEYRALNTRGSLASEDVPVVPWNVRLKIAKEVATAITYLHTAFPRIIIHRDIKATNIFLDKNGTAKLIVAVTLPEGKSWIEEDGDLRARGEPVEFGGDSNDMRLFQMKMFLDLALRCCEERNEDRPKMILVAKQIKLIEKASPGSEMLENGSEDANI